MPASVDFWAVVIPHAGLFAVIALLCAVLAMARTSTDQPDRAAPSPRRRPDPPAAVPPHRHVERAEPARRAAARRPTVDEGTGDARAA